MKKPSEPAKFRGLFTNTPVILSALWAAVLITTGALFFFGYTSLDRAKQAAGSGRSAAYSELVAFSVWTAALGGLASCLTGAAASVVLLRANRLSSARDDAVKADGEKRRLIQSINSAVEEERRSIAVEIHDELNATVVSMKHQAQGIVALAIELQQVPGASDSATEVAKRANNIVDVSNSLYKHGREIVTRLRPEVLDMMGLVRALEDLLSHANNSQKGRRYDLKTSGELDGIDGPTSIAIYRIVQEAMSNIAKHSGASSASVALSARHSTYELVVQDNGRGFDPAKTQKGIGTVGMAERVLAIGGTLELRSAMGSGTTVLVHLPRTKRGLH